MPETTFEIDPQHAVPLKTLRLMIAERPKLRSMQRWHKDGRMNQHTREIIKFPAIKNASNELVSTVAAYQHFITELNRKQAH